MDRFIADKLVLALCMRLLLNWFHTTPKVQSHLHLPKSYLIYLITRRHATISLANGSLCRREKDIKQIENGPF